MNHNIQREAAFEIHKYEPNGGSNGVILITSRHGAGLESDLTQRLLDSINFQEAPFSRKTAEEYVDLEQDVGADEYAHALARKMVDRAGVSVYVGTCLSPRALFDGNRAHENSIIRLLGHYVPENIQRQYIPSILGFNNAISFANQIANLQIAVHSMWPFSPLNAGDGIHAVGNDIPLEEQIRRYKEGTTKRPDLCLINKIMMGASPDQMKGVDAADMELNRFFFEGLGQEGVWVTNNDPYPMGSFLGKPSEKAEVASDYFVFSSRPDRKGAIILENNKNIFADRAGVSTSFMVNPDKIEAVSERHSQLFTEWLENGSRGRT